MKKKYISPQTASHVLATVLPLATSKFDTSADSQDIILTEDEVNEFTSRRRRDIWADETDDEQD